MAEYCAWKPTEAELLSILNQAHCVFWSDVSSCDNFSLLIDYWGMAALPDSAYHEWQTKIAEAVIYHQGNKFHDDSCTIIYVEQHPDYSEVFGKRLTV